MQEPGANTTRPYNNRKAKIMSKKGMLLALAAISAAISVLPAAASANWGVTPVGAEFTGTGGLLRLVAAGEPTIECTGHTSSGKYDNTGTTGTFTLHLLECDTKVLFTFDCSTTGSPADKTISIHGTFHNVTITNGKRGVLLTPEPFEIKCTSIGNPIRFTGTLIGEVTAPSGPCPLNGVKNITLKFAVSGGSQVHKTTDGHNTEYDLAATTTGGSAVTAALESETTNTFTNPKEVTIDCNTP
jgi:hypothetical protein